MLKKSDIIKKTDVSSYREIEINKGNIAMDDAFKKNRICLKKQ